MAAVYGIRLLLCAKLALMTREHALLTRMRQTPFGWGQDERHQDRPPAYARTALRLIDELLRRTTSQGAQEDNTP